MTQAKVLGRLMQGEAPGTPEEWQELGELLSAFATFASVLNEELNSIELALDILEGIAEVMADAQPVHVQSLLKEVVKNAHKGQRVSLSDLPGEDGAHGGGGPVESNDGGYLSPER